MTVPQIDELISLVGGHPYLIQIAFKHFQAIADNDYWHEFIRLAPTNASPYGNYLRQLLKILQANAELSRALVRAIDTEEGIALPSEIGFKLTGLGLVDNIGDLYFVNHSLYRQYFLTHINELQS